MYPQLFSSAVIADYSPCTLVKREMIHSVGLKLTSTFSFTYKSAELPRIGPYSFVLNEPTTLLSIFLIFIPCIPNCRGKRK